ncbi:MAG: acyl-CoA reductase [Azospirillaceae bacterium]|nr:acyl-CoA reductase [Azospirillaceae bacterium]
MSLPQRTADRNRPIAAVTIFDEDGGRTPCHAGDLRVRLEKARQATAASFSAARVDLVAGVASRILSLPKHLTAPGIVHFAYWTRRAALYRLGRSFQARLPDGCLAKPRGLAFHLPPQNVEAIFLYSWVIAFLTGNANIVRLPSELSPQIQGVLDLFLEALASAAEDSQIFVTYPVSEDLNRDISAQSDVRLVWGGDAKVRAFAPLPLRHGGKAIWFGDRVSFAVLDGEALVGLSPAAREELVSRLYNDIFIFDQMACSSPQVIHVVGDRTRHGEAVARLLDDLDRVAARKNTVPATGQVIRKMTALCTLAGQGHAVEGKRLSNALTVATMAGGDFPIAAIGGGFLQIRYLSALDALSDRIAENHQTLTYFGFGQAELSRMAERSTGQGLSRIVPVGEALDFSAVWDGYDLPGELSRLVTIR